MNLGNWNEVCSPLCSPNRSGSLLFADWELYCTGPVTWKQLGKVIKIKQSNKQETEQM